MERVVGGGDAEREDGDASVEDGDHVPRGVALPLPSRNPAEGGREAHVDRVAPLARLERVEQVEAGRRGVHLEERDARVDVLLLVRLRLTANGLTLSVFVPERVVEHQHGKLHVLLTLVVQPQVNQGRYIIGLHGKDFFHELSRTL